MENVWNPKITNSNKPLYIALADALESDIRSGILKPGQKLPPQRELADQMGVNLSTVTRAFRLCELKGILSGVVGRGTFIASDAKVPLSLAGTENNSDRIEMGQILPLYCLDGETAKMAKAVFLELDMERLIRYSEPEGHLHHRIVGAEWLKRFNISASAEEILVTPGSQNALANCLLTLFSHGDRIAVDALTYPGFKALAALHGIRLVPIESTEEGMNPKALLNACKNEGIKGIYLMPEMQNPTTTAMTQGCREQIADIIEKFNLVLMEDDAYAFTGDSKSIPVSALAPRHGIYIGGTAKILGAGFRISYVKVPESYQEALKTGLLNTSWMASPVTAGIVSGLIESGEVEIIIRNKLKEAEKRNALASKVLSGCKMANRPNGFFLWLRLPGEWRGREFELALREAGVQVFCSEKFVVGSVSSPTAARVSLSGPGTMAELARGLEIIKDMIHKGCGDPSGIL